MIYTNKIVGCLLLMVLFFTSCVPLKKTLYLQNKQQLLINKEIFETSTPYTHVIAKGDVLDIDISNITPERLSDVSGKSKGATESSMGSSGVDAQILRGYIVDDQGDVQLPLLGKVKVEGLTLLQAQSMLNKEASEYVVNSFVKVKLLSFHITVLGEVGKPGKLQINTQKVNIYEVVAMAGDLPITANHEKIRVVRILGQNVVTHYIDITSVEAYKSEVFYLQPGDIVYVEPVKAKVAQVNLIGLTIVTTIMNTLFFVINLLVITKVI